MSWIVLAALLSLAALPPTLEAEQLTTVAVVDIDQVYNSFYRDSQDVRALEDLRQEFQDEINDELAGLETLRDRRLQAQNAGNQRRVDALNEEISQLEQFLEDLTRRRRQQLAQQQQELLSDTFFLEMQAAIQFVAESEGYTIVLRTDFEGIQWWSNLVDISELVVRRLIDASSR